MIDPAALRDEAVQLRDAGSLDRAEAAALKAVELAPGDRDLLFLLGDIRYRAGRYTAALEVFDRLVAERPAGENGWYNRGLCHENLGRWAEAAGDFDRYLSIVPDDTDGLVHQGKCAWQSSQPAAAWTSLSRAISLDPGKASAYFYRALAAIDLERHQEGRADCDRAEQLGFDAPSIPYNRALCCHRMGDLAAARADLDRYIESRPQDADGWERRGRVKLDLGDRQGARLDMERAIACDPDRRERVAGLLAAPAGEADPDRPTGRDVLGALGWFTAALLAVAAVLALLILVILPYAGKHDTAGTILMIATTLALIPVGIWAVARKILFIRLSVSWLSGRLLSMRRGRQLAGLVILGAGLWLGFSLVQTWWTHGFTPSGRRLKEAILAGGFVMVVIGFGLVMLFGEPEEPAS